MGSRSCRRVLQGSGVGGVGSALARVGAGKIQIVVLKALPFFNIIIFLKAKYWLKSQGKALQWPLSGYMGWWGAQGGLLPSFGAARGRVLPPQPNSSLGFLLSPRRAARVISQEGGVVFPLFT